jgi:hypothetical protein
MKTIGKFISEKRSFDGGNEISSGQPEHSSLQQAALVGEDTDGTECPTEDLEELTGIELLERDLDILTTVEQAVRAGEAYTEEWGMCREQYNEIYWEINRL